MLKFHPARRRAASPRSRTTRSRVTFDLPAELRDEFRFRAGQHVALRRVIGGQRRAADLFDRRIPRARRRSRSASACRRAGACPRSSRSHAQPGDTIDVLTPNGSFHADAEARRAAATTPRSRRAAASRRCCPSRRRRSSATRQQPLPALLRQHRAARRTMFLEDVLALKDRFLTRFSRRLRDEPRAAGRRMAQWPDRRARSSREFARHDLSRPRKSTSSSSAGRARWAKTSRGALARARREGAHPCRAFHARRDAAVPAPAACRTTAAKPVPAAGSRQAQTSRS